MGLVEIMKHVRLWLGLWRQGWLSSTLWYTHEPKLPADNWRYTPFLPPHLLGCDRFTIFGHFLLMLLIFHCSWIGVDFGTYSC